MIFLGSNLWRCRIRGRGLITDAGQISLPLAEQPRAHAPLPPYRFLDD